MLKWPMHAIRTPNTTRVAVEEVIAATSCPMKGTTKNTITATGTSATVRNIVGVRMVSARFRRV